MLGKQIVPRQTIMKRKFKQWWSTTPPISTKQTTNHWTQKRTAYDDGNSQS
jgi:hypothetical protein